MLHLNEIFKECICENKKLPISISELQSWLKKKEYKLSSADQRALADKIAEYIFRYYAKSPNN